MKRHKRGRGGKIFLLLGTLCVIAAVSLTAYNRVISYRAGQRSADVLERLARIRGDVREEPGSTPVPAPEREPIGLNSVSAPGDRLEDYPGGESEIEIPDYLLDPERDMPARGVDGVAYAGTLSFPSLGLELPVASSWSDELLRSTPCVYSGSAYRDNIVICAHNYTAHFGKIGTLPADSEVIFTDMDGNRFRYRVNDIELLRAAAVEEMTESDYALTLFTCTLDGQNRLTVRCVRSASESDAG